MKNIKVLTVLFFFVAVVEVVAEYFHYFPVIYVFKPLMPIMLMLLYTAHSSVRSAFFYVTLSTSMLTNVFFISKETEWLYYGLIIFMIHRVVKIIYIAKLIHLKDFVPVLISSVPFLAIFFYIFYQTDLFDAKMYGIIAIHNVLISILGGMALSDYVMNGNIGNEDNIANYNSNRSAWLLICVLSFAMLHFIIFIEKFYIELRMFRSMAMSLNAFAYYAFYRFVTAIEKDERTVT